MTRGFGDRIATRRASGRAALPASLAGPGALDMRMTRERVLARLAGRAPACASGRTSHGRSSAVIGGHGEHLPRADAHVPDAGLHSPLRTLTPA